MRSTLRYVPQSYAIFELTPSDEYHDENGAFHSHNTRHVSWKYLCSRGHVSEVSHQPDPCPSCVDRTRI